MSTDLVVTSGMDEAKRQALMESLGFGALESGKRDRLPRLRINKHFETPEGKNIPPKTWTIEVPEIGRVYGRPAEFRVFAQGHQIQHYDEDFRWEDKEGNQRKGKTLNRTIIVFDKRNEMIDQLGTVRCGKQYYTKEEYAALSEKEKKEQAKRKPYVHTFGLIRFDEAVDESGNKHKIDWTPFHWDATGQNRNALNDALKTINNHKRLPMEYAMTVDLQRRQNGDLVWYTAEPTVNLQEVLPITEEDQALLQHFMYHVKAINDWIKEQYNKALKGVVDEDEQELADSFEDAGGTIIDADFEDDIPF